VVVVVQSLLRVLQGGCLRGFQPSRHQQIPQGMALLLAHY
jgi:hypothetical protein